MKHKKHIQTLRKIAEAVVPVGNARIASMLIYKNNVVAIGYNQRKSHPFQSKFSKNDDAIYLHSETDCIKNALREISLDVLSRCTLYVMRVKRPDDNPTKFVFGNAKPCRGCQAAITQFGIKRVYFSKDDDTFEFM